MSAHGDVELVQVVRGDAVDCVHRGRVSVVDASGSVIYEAGDGDSIGWMRSIGKPFQAAAVHELGAVERYGLTDQEIAVIAGSHNGTAEQVRLVESMLAKIGVDVRDLRCGVSAPLDRQAHEALIANGVKPSALHHNCSGKHSGMLAACRAQGWRIEDYTYIEHPLQQHILKTLARAADLDTNQIAIALDGCSVPTFGLPLRHIARAFAALGVAEVDTSLGAVAQVMATYPIIFSGERRQDAALVRATGGRLIAKDGAEGIVGVSVRDKGVGIALKVSDGSIRAIMPTLVALLRALDYLTPDEARQLEAQYPRAIKIHTGKVVGEMRVILPIDI